MLLQSVIGRIGREKRYECAQIISQLLVKELAADPDVDSMQVVVTDQEYLDAFKTRRFGRSTYELLRKLDKRVYAALPNQLFLVSTRDTTEEGVTTSLRVTATRMTTPRM